MMGLNDMISKGTLCKWYLGCIVIIGVCLLLSGCWDRREFDDRRMILAIGIDTADQGGATQGNDVSQVETFVQPYGSKRYRLSLQLMNLTPSKGSGGSPQGEISTYVISNTGESMFEMTRDMLGQVSESLWFEHVQAIIVSEAAVRQGGLQPIIDLFRRDKEMRWLMKIMITAGEARALLEYQPPSGESSGIVMTKSLAMYRKNLHLPGEFSDLGTMTRGIDNKSRVLITRVELVDHVVKLGGMALFKDNKFNSYIDEYATKGGNFINGSEKSAIITAQCPDHPGKVMAFELFRHDTKLISHVAGENIYYTLDIAMRGNIGEMQCARQHDTMDAGEIHKFEQLVAEEVKRNVLYTFQTYQSLQVDGGSFGAKLKAYEPLVWEKVKDHWNEEVFPNTSLLVSVNVKIEGIGAHK